MFSAIAAIDIALAYFRLPCSALLRSNELTHTGSWQPHHGSHPPTSGCRTICRHAFRNCVLQALIIAITKETLYHISQSIISLSLCTPVVYVHVQPFQSSHDRILENHMHALSVHAKLCQDSACRQFLFWIFVQLILVIFAIVSCSPAPCVHAPELTHLCR